MLSSENNGLPRSFENVFPSEDDLPHSCQGERIFISFSNGGNGGHTSSSLLPPPPQVTLPMSCFLQDEKYEVTQALLACKHQDGKFVCANVLKMKLHINRLGILGVIFPRELVIELVLLSLSKTYSQFIKDYYMMDHDVTLIDLTYMLIVAEVEMLKTTSQAKIFEGSVSKISMDIGNVNIGSPEKVSLHNGKGSAKVKPFDHTVKRKTNSEIVPCANPKRSMCFYCQLEGHWMRSCPDYLKDLRDTKVKLCDSTLESKRKKEASEE
ncbi:hypothetical protein Lser_V15G20189 [Lactuca serriola]